MVIVRNCDAYYGEREEGSNSFETKEALHLWNQAIVRLTSATA